MVETNQPRRQRAPVEIPLNEATIFRWWKQVLGHVAGCTLDHPSMKPPSFDGGNAWGEVAEWVGGLGDPSMKPPSFDGGNHRLAIVELAYDRCPQ